MRVWDKKQRVPSSGTQSLVATEGYPYPQGRGELGE